MIIIGLDPGLRFTGWGVIEKRGNKINYIASGVICTNSADNIPKRLVFLHNSLNEVLEKYSPNVAAIEEIFINNNNASSLKLSQARGVIIMTPALKNIDIYEYAPNTIKKTVTGAGHADKIQVQKMVQMILPKSKSCNSKLDTTDALAISLCHAYNTKG